MLMSFVTYSGAAQEGTTSTLFPDVSVNHWAYQQINDLQRMNYIYGYPDGSFKPDDYITRAEFMTMLANVLKDSYSSGAKYDHSKEEDIVSVTHWAYSSINEVFKYMPSEYRNKFNTKAYKPDELISRGEVVQVIAFVISEHNHFTFGGAGGTEIVPEDSHNSKYAGGIEICLFNGIINGYPDGTFRPDNQISRAEISTIMINVINFTKPRPW
jgi:hypothetical protein